MALVVTLIMLAAITFMAVTFLVVSRREGATVDTIEQQSNAKFAAEAGFESAKAQILARMIASGNGLKNDMLVSTNYISLFGFTNTGSAAAISSPLNVSYYYNTNSLQYPPFTPNLTLADGQTMLKNLFILPRAPVFATNNAGQQDFRFWLDLNRNGLYDPTGIDTNGNFNFGDPEWIGILDRPDQPHSSSNLFVGRYCFIALPIGDSLDMNYSHNQSLNVSNGTSISGAANDGFLRNQGVGSWEINLGAFFHYLDSNWDNNTYGFTVPYAYNTPFGSQNRCTDFGLALQLQQFRYNGSLLNLNTIFNTFPSNYLSIYNDPNIDYAGFGPVMTSSFLSGNYLNGNRFSAGWSGADNPSLFYSTQDIFNNPYSANYGLQSLPSLLTNNVPVSSYDRYSFYRMLSQMSFESAPEPTYNTNLMPGLASWPYTRKINLNFNTIGTNYVDVAGVLHTTTFTSNNFVPWANAENFFTNVADRLLRATFTSPIYVTNVVGGIARSVTTNYLSITNIPIYPANLYTPAVHRILQLTANIWDAMTNKTAGIAGAGGLAMDYPTVMRPRISYNITNYAGTLTTNVWINGYFEQGGMNSVQWAAFLGTSNLDLRRPNDLISLTTPASNPYNPSTNNIYGIPYVIGARTGFPVFNKFNFVPIFQMTRKMELLKNGQGVINATNLIYEISVSNMFGADFWYPSTNTAGYSNKLSVYFADDLDSTLTVSNAPSLVIPPLKFINGYVTTYPAGSWKGTSNMFDITRGVAASFQTNISTNMINAQDTLLLFNNNNVPSGITNADLLQTIPFQNNSYFIPYFKMNITNRLRGYIYDTDASGTTNRIVDYVQLGGLAQSPGLDLALDVQGLFQTQQTNFPARFQMWSTTPSGTNGPLGFLNQFNISQSYWLSNSIPNAIWQPVQLDPGLGYSSTSNAQYAFNQWVLTKADLSPHQAPLSAFMRVGENFVWAAKDPLLHYTVNDLTEPSPNVYSPKPNLYPLDFKSMRQLAFDTTLAQVRSERYQAWNYAVPDQALYGNIGVNQMAYKDSAITYPDLWNFPTNKFPNIGWLGRVHRGTPWQSVYLKAGSVDPNIWSNWTGNVNTTNTPVINGNVTNYIVYYPPPTPTNNTYLVINFGPKRDVDYTQPTNDWALMDLFTTAPDDNASRGQLSVNQTNMAAWAAVLTGVHVLTNNVSGTYIDPNDGFNGFQRIYTALTNYLGTNANIPVGQVPGSLPGNVFTRVGQILALPEFTTNSPYVVNAPLGTYRDEVYERIPQQIMGLLRVGSPRYVVFAYGQSLKPAQNSVVYSGANFGLCTNYQITGEYSSRTVFRVENQPVPGYPVAQQPKVVIESFNVMQPE